MIYGYIRTSTDKQNNENQRFEIKQFAENNNLVIDRWTEETISSRKPLEQRKLGILLKMIKSGGIIIASEISRLGRNLLEIMSILNCCINRGCQLWTLKDNHRLGNNIEAKVLAFAFGLAAEIERNLISQRTKNCLARLKAENKPIGRPKGSKNKKYKLSGKEPIIKKNTEPKFEKKLYGKIITCSLFYIA